MTENLERKSREAGEGGVLPRGATLRKGASFKIKYSYRSSLPFSSLVAVTCGAAMFSALALMAQQLLLTADLTALRIANAPNGRFDSQKFSVPLPGNNAGDQLLHSINTAVSFVLFQNTVTRITTSLLCRRRWRVLWPLRACVSVWLTKRGRPWLPFMLCVPLRLPSRPSSSSCLLK